MSISDATSYRGPTGDLNCPKCNTPLLPQATFCSSCGERLDKTKDLSLLMQDEQDITTDYRITLLVRRRPGVNLYLALDNQRSRQGQQRMVAIRDIDITSLQDEARVQAIELVQQEYDLLRHWHLPHVMPVVDLRYFQGHLFVVAGYPSAAPALSDKSENAKPTSAEAEAPAGYMSRLYTLQDFLQSGQGLPSEQQILKWMDSLCQALDSLHRHQVVIGELDPYTIILNENSDKAKPVLMISWLHPRLRDLLPPLQVSRSPMSYFSAPEALEAKAEPRSDIYSLGAILYLLLTGSPPGESALRAGGRLRSPRELNSRISSHVNDCVMQALSINPAERFQSAGALAEALHNPRFGRPQPQTLKSNRRDDEVNHTSAADDGDVETVRIIPLSYKHVAHWQTSRPQTSTPDPIPHRPHTPLPTSQSQELEAIQAEWQQQPPTSLQSTPLAATPPIDTKREDQLTVPERQVDEQETTEGQQESSQNGTTPQPQQASQRASVPTWKQRITGMLPAITPELLKKGLGRQPSAPARPLAEDAGTVEADSQNEAATTWFKQLQRMLLGQQQHTIMAAAIVEFPLRVQPNQVFSLRLHVMGRDELTLPPGAKKGIRPAGLSSLVHGDTALIEVRSVLHQSYAYIVQQANVTIPATGYVAEVTIPMQPLSSAPSGRRDRYHIFFLDEQRRPLYEKPFVVEVFVSHLVKRGHEGHHVLTIPI